MAGKGDHRQPKGGVHRRDNPVKVAIVKASLSAKDYERFYGKGK